MLSHERAYSQSAVFFRRSIIAGRATKGARKLVATYS
jgi:hypothetical protein